MATRDGVKMSKQERRVLGKKLKSQKTLFRHENIICSTTPTKHLVVANGGLGNDIELEELWTIFSQHGSIVDIIMKPRKPFAFVSFASEKEASDAVNGIHGRVLQHPEELSRPNVTFYLSYVEKIPDVPCPADGLPPPPPGLRLMEDFISDDYEQRLLSTIDWQQFSGAEQSLKHRRVKHFGFRFMYETNNVDRSHPLDEKIPEECHALLDDLLQRNLISRMPDQLTVNQYSPGQGIPPHIDTHSAFEDEIVILSLGSQIVMEFSHPSDCHVPVLLPRRSVTVLSGESRYLWTHGITPRKSDVVGAAGSLEAELTQQRLTLLKRGTRTSYTFRTVRHTPCDCSYVQQCDSQSQNQTKKDMDLKQCSDPTMPISDEEALRLESCHVHQVYEEIAHHFSSTRHTPWPQVVKFLEQLSSNALVADVGCGNGKYLGVVPKAFTIGCDRSMSLCDICRDRGHSVLVCDGLSLPFRDGVFDAVICIAVIHHLSTEERRIRALLEITRILRLNGQALIYVWALEQEKDGVKSKYLKESKKQGTVMSNQSNSASDNLSDCLENQGTVVNNQGDVELNYVSSSTDVEMPVHTNRTAFKSQDLLVPWHAKADKQNHKIHQNKPLDGSVETNPSSSKEHRFQSSTSHQTVNVDNTSLDNKMVGKTVKIPCEQKETFHRYYHVFQNGELEHLCSLVPSLKVLKSYYDQGNWCIVVERQEMSDS